MDGPDGTRDIFRAIYASDHWKGGSGEGSDVAATEPYRQVLEALVSGTDIEYVVDAGCGDWQFSRLVDWSGKRYLGVDVVPEVVAENRRAFATQDVTFVEGDIRAQRLPKADLLVCKDVLQHWDLESVAAFLTRNLPRYRYALITNDLTSVHIAPEMLNTEIPIGHWRTLDLERPPFGVPRSGDSTSTFAVSGRSVRCCSSGGRTGRSRRCAATRRCARLARSTSRPHGRNRGRSPRGQDPQMVRPYASAASFAACRSDSSWVCAACTPA